MFSVYLQGLEPKLITDYNSIKLDKFYNELQNYCYVLKHRSYKCMMYLIL